MWGFLSSTLPAWKQPAADYRETSESEFYVCGTGTICWMWGASRWCLCLEMTEVFSVILSVLGCAPVPPQNRYFRSLREWFCISSILVWLTSSSLSPESFHSKCPFLAADLSLTKPLGHRKDFPQLHFQDKFLLFYIYFLSMLILLGFEQKPHWFPGRHPELEPPLSSPAAQSCCTPGLQVEKEQEGCRKSHRSPQEPVVQGFPSSTKTCHTRKPCGKCSSCFLICNLCVCLGFVLVCRGGSAWPDKPN